MDYNSAQNQVMQLKSQADQVAQSVTQLATKLQTSVPDPNLARELTLDLREAALGIQRQNQQTLMLIDQMAQYIHMLESEVQQAQMQPQYQPQMQPRGWASPQPMMGAPGGGFMSNMLTGLGLGAGFGLAEDAVNGIFNAL